MASKAARTFTPPADPLDGVIEQIGFGKFQLILYAAIGLAIMGDGAEMLNVALVTRALGEEWSLSSTQRGALGSTVFVGFLLGSVVAGRVGDKYGRKFPLLMAVSMLFVSGFASAFAVHYESLLVLRALVGFAIGAAVVLVNTLFAEFCPADHRGRWLILNSLFFPLGEVVAAVLAWLVMPNFESGHWRAMFALCSVPAFVCFVFGVSWLPESPRYLYEVGDITELETVLRRVAFTNGTPLPDLRPLQSRRAGRDNPALAASRGSLKELFTPNMRVLTLLLWPTWFGVAVVFYGLVYYLPIVFGEQSDKGESGGEAHLDIIIAALVEVPATLLVAFTIDVPWIGRRRLIWVPALLASLALVFCIALDLGSAFDAFAFIAKLSITASFSVLFPYTAEVHPTSVRSTGLGMGSAFNRLGGIVTPLMVEGLHDSSLKAPFWAFLFAALLVAICGGCLPVETTGKSLAEITLQNEYNPPKVPIDLDLSDEEEGKDEEDQSRMLLDGGGQTSDAIRSY